MDIGIAASCANIFFDFGCNYSRKVWRGFLLIFFNRLFILVFSLYIGSFFFKIKNKRSFSQGASLFIEYFFLYVCPPPSETTIREIYLTRSTYVYGFLVGCIFVFGSLPGIAPDIPHQFIQKLINSPLTWLHP